MSVNDWGLDYKHAKRVLGQYPAILTSHLVNNLHLLNRDLLEAKFSGMLSTNFRGNHFAFVQNLDSPKLSFRESMSLESNLTLDEIKKRML